MPPKLSIIIPCYNCDSTLREAVDSCYTQGFSEDEFEIIMVDDCSSDATRTTMEMIAKEHLNIKLFFHEKNRGGGATRNTAVTNSLADVIFCLDSDDLLPPQTLSKMLAYLKEKNCDGVCFHYSVNFRGINQNDVSHIVTMSRPGEKITFTDLFQQNGEMCGLYQVFMLTKSSFWKAGGYPIKHGFDTQGFAWRFLTAGLVAYTCPNTTYLLRVEFKESYYLREYNNGKRNFNWQAIFLENFEFFDSETKIFIKNFDCKNFTRDIFAEVVARKKFLDNDYLSYIGNKPKHDTVAVHNVNPINRNSLFGWYLRIKKKMCG